MNFERVLSLEAEASFLEPTRDSAATAQTPGIGAHPDLESLLSALEHERIAALAYFLWQQRGCPHGSPDDDWFCAQQTIRENR